MLENIKLWRTKSGIYTWNLKSLFHNVILLVMLESLCHIWFKIPLLGGKKEGKKSQTSEYILFGRSVLSKIFKRSVEQFKFSWRGNGREGDSSKLYLLCIRLLAILTFFPFLLLKANAPSNPLKSICWEVYYMKCFCQQSIEIDYLCIKWWQGCKANTEKGPHYTPFQNLCCNLTSFL